jgi:prepilin-type N-terminal cleavage/methylation domain-containing protein
MFIEPGKHEIADCGLRTAHGRFFRNASRAFTLLEISLAVAILGLMSLAIYRFVQSNLIALRVSSVASAADARYGGLREILAAQWQGLTVGTGALAGQPLKLNDRSRDEVTWVCSAGPGLLTRYAPGDFVVTMALKPPDKGSKRLDLGFLRRPKDDPSITNARESWVPLIENVESLQIRYFDARLNTWVDRWTDIVVLPELVKVVIGRGDSAVTWEANIALRRHPF